MALLLGDAETDTMHRPVTRGHDGSIPSMKGVEGGEGTIGRYLGRDMSGPLSSELKVPARKNGKYY